MVKMEYDIIWEMDSAFLSDTYHKFNKKKFRIINSDMYMDTFFKDCYTIDDERYKLQPDYPHGLYND